MRILILGMDGYLGWSLANSLPGEKFSIYGIDNFYRRKWVKEMQSVSAVPVASMEERIKAYKKANRKEINFFKGNITNYEFLNHVVKKVRPEVIVHFAQCPSAPYSMMNQKKCVWVQQNNITGTLNLIHAVKEHVPGAHIIKLGTMGEYGTPNLDIPEGFFEVEYRGRKDRLPFPRQANSWYHLSKVHDSNNLQFACRNYGIRCTDIMQGIVFGFHSNADKGTKELNTRLDFDEAFGTIINRFCCQAVIDYPLTSYGKGTQLRSFLPLSDSMKCFQLVIENAAASGEYRVVNQFANVHSINELSRKVSAVCRQLGIAVKTKPIENPRKEKEHHYYHPDNNNLKSIGYKPATEFDEEIRKMITGLLPFRKRILKYKAILNPTIHW
ncbi:MAG: NAD-dependent epimerase/dehydratase family protein [Bacteroidetes bacterium]|nr:NAD-dependent epimerase/dehydratase family protein [Bacteroidota bacterium]MBS1932165.1 NAD-dependent epimerase/dehydratase family protein [Bacteroidota bacterium]